MGVQGKHGGSALYWKLMAVGRIGHKQPAANHLLSVIIVSLRMADLGREMMTIVILITGIHRKYPKLNPHQIKLNKY